MERELRIGMHLVFIDDCRKERDCLLTAIHGDPRGCKVVPIRKAAKELTEEERASGEWILDDNTPPLYAYKQAEHGGYVVYVVEHIEPGSLWPCINLVVVSENENAQDQYGRQIDERHTSVVHWSSSSAIGYCYRFADERVDWSQMQQTIS
jgi:hypothetical protein